jgi:hypothetical protein
MLAQPSPPGSLGAIERSANFYLHISKGSANTYHVDAIGATGRPITNPSMPDPLGELRSAYRFLEGVHSFVTRIEGLAEAFYKDRTVPHQEIRKVLGGALFDGVIRKDRNLSGLWDESLREAERHGQVLRLRLIVDAPELEELPWELSFDRERKEFLCRDAKTSLVRDMKPDLIHPHPIIFPFRLLVVIANPEGWGRFDVESERSTLKELESKYPDRVITDWLEKATWRDLQDRLVAGIPYHAVHVIGSGDETSGGAIELFDAKKRGMEPIRADEFSALLGSHSSLQVVMLNSCFSAGIAAELARKDIPAVLSWRANVWEETCTAFISRLYAALIEGELVDTAIRNGRFAVGGIGWAQLVAYLRCNEIRLEAPSGADAAALPPIPSPKPPNAEGLCKEAEGFYEAGDFQKALQVYGQAIDLSPHHVRAHYGRIDCIEQLEGIEAAEEARSWLTKQSWTH